jgi:hypothetical protein
MKSTGPVAATSVARGAPPEVEGCNRGDREQDRDRPGLVEPEVVAALARPHRRNRDRQEGEGKGAVEDARIDAAQPATEVAQSHRQRRLVHVINL